MSRHHPTKYLYLSLFLGNTQRHGGVKRSEQVHELIQQYDVVSVNPYQSRGASVLMALTRPFSLLSSVAFAIYLFAMKGASLVGAAQYAVASVGLKAQLRRYPAEIVVLETAPGMSILFAHYLHFRKQPYIAVPQNIEHLVQNQRVRAFRSNGALYSSELACLRNALTVIAMSTFDAAILRCHAIDAHAVPYFPSAQDAKRFAAIRNQRSAETCRDPMYLLIGTVTNPPTFAGMKRVLRAAQECGLRGRIVVAGFGTEALQSFASPTITVLGSIDESTLDALLVATQAVLINQPQTTGFLTKIADMNLCGVPQLVLSDYFQASGLAEYGVIYATVADLDTAATVNVRRTFEAAPVRSAFDAVLRFADSRLRPSNNLM